jgi:hypothetical protein
MSQYAGLIEIAFTATVTLGVLAWQYWTVRDAGKPKDALPVDSGHPEGEHHPHNR